MFDVLYDRWRRTSTDLLEDPDFTEFYEWIVELGNQPNEVDEAAFRAVWDDVTDHDDPGYDAALSWAQDRGYVIDPGDTVDVVEGIPRG